MKLSDIMGHAGLAGYAEIALLIFFATFVTILIRTLRHSDRAEIEHASRLPLEDEPNPSPGDQS